MKKDVNQILESLIEGHLDKPTATILVATKSDKLYFVGEALLIEAGLMLLHAYFWRLYGVRRIGSKA